MTELRHSAAHDAVTLPAPAGGFARGVETIGVVGAGHVGGALAIALRRAGYSVLGPAGRGQVPMGADAILLCVPDAEIAKAAEVVAGAARLVAHTSGATPLSALDPAGRAGAELFGFHPLQTFAAAGTDVRGCGCAIAGSSPRAVEAAAGIARRLGMAPFEIDDRNRAAYHAAASIASNFLVTLEHVAESVAGAAGLDPSQARRLLVPLVRATVENWATHGPRAALTGPIARGDAETVAAQRVAVEAAHPDLVPLFDALVEQTRVLARGSSLPSPHLEGSDPKGSDPGLGGSEPAGPAASDGQRAVVAA